MELFIIELGDISYPAFEAREVILLPGVIENVGLQNGHVDPAQQLEVGNVLQRSFTNDRQDTTRCPVIDDIREILGDAHRDAGGAPCLELDDAPVNYGNIRRHGSARWSRKGDRHRKYRDDRGRAGRTLHLISTW